MSATYAQSHLRQAAHWIDEATKLANTERWDDERTHALTMARENVRRARDWLTRAIEAPRETPMCDNSQVERHGERRAAEYAMVMLDTTSLDAAALFCGDCMKLAFLDFLSDPEEIAGYEIRRLT